MEETQFRAFYEFLDQWLVENDVLYDIQAYKDAFVAGWRAAEQKNNSGESVADSPL